MLQVNLNSTSSISSREQAIFSLSVSFNCEANPKYQRNTDIAVKWAPLMENKLPGRLLLATLESNPRGTKTHQSRLSDSTEQVPTCRLCTVKPVRPLPEQWTWVHGEMNKPRHTSASPTGDAGARPRLNRTQSNWNTNLNPLECASYRRNRITASRNCELSHWTA